MGGEWELFASGAGRLTLEEKWRWKMAGKFLRKLARLRGFGVKKESKYFVVFNEKTGGGEIKVPSKLRLPFSVDGCTKWSTYEFCEDLKRTAEFLFPGRFRTSEDCHYTSEDCYYTDSGDSEIRCDGISDEDYLIRLEDHFPAGGAAHLRVIKNSIPPLVIMCMDEILKSQGPNAAEKVIKDYNIRPCI